MTAPRILQNLALVGFMGTGKSTVGNIVAHALGFDFLDTDELIEQESGLTISEIFSRFGETAFRDLERRVGEQLKTRQRTVIATGGGFACNEANLNTLKDHALVVCLWASPEAIWERVRHQNHRPLLRDPQPLEKIRSLLAQREPFYRQADVLVNTELRSAREVALHIVHESPFGRSTREPES